MATLSVHLTLLYMSKLTQLTSYASKKSFEWVPFQHFLFLCIPVSLQMLTAKWFMWFSVLPLCPTPHPNPLHPSLPPTTTIITTMFTISHPASRALWSVPSPSHPTSSTMLRRYMSLCFDWLLAESLLMLAWPQGTELLVSLDVFHNIK